MKTTKKPTPDRAASAPGPMVADGWFPVARALRPQGRRGELLCESLTDLPGILAKGVSLRGTPPQPAGDGTDRPYELDEAWEPQGRNAGRIVLKLVDVGSITQAEALKGYTFSIEERTLPAMEEGSFLVRDLVGCALLDGAQRVGTIAEIQFAVGSDGRTRLEDVPDLLVVSLDDPSDAEPVMIPFVKLWLEAVDLSTHEVRMHLPAGLIEDLQALTFVGSDSTDGADA